MTFILLAFLIGAVVQHVRKRPSPAPAAAAPTPKVWPKPPYVLKASKSKSAPTTDEDR